MMRENVKKYPAKLVLSLLILIIGLSFIYPVIFTLANSFMADWEINEYYGAREGLADAADSSGDAVQLELIPFEVTFGQYYSILIGRTEYLFMFWNSVILILPILAGQLAVAALAAYAFMLSKSRVLRVIYFFYIAVMLLPYQVTLVPNYIIANRLDLIDSRLAIILPNIFGTFGVFLLRQYMTSIPMSCIEAARVDGAGHIKVFLNVILPLVRPGLAALSVLIFIDNWNLVEQPLIFLSDPLKEPLSIFLSVINNQDPGIAFAASFIYMVPMILLFLLGEEHLVSSIGLQMSGVKA